MRQVNIIELNIVGISNDDFFLARPWVRVSVRADHS